VTVTGVATELPLAGVVIVIIPFEVAAKVGDVSRSIKTMDFIGTSCVESLVEVEVRRCKSRPGYSRYANGIQKKPVTINRAATGNR
jgi:hypothetical protein